MSIPDLSRWTDPHVFDAGNPAAERSTRAVMWITAVMMVVESVERLFSPQPIHYQLAVVVAVVGLLVNVVSALILGHAHHGDDHGHEHGHAHHHDLNLKSAYFHVIADAATSVLAILALLGGWFYGWSWLDPAMGIVGALLVGNWARGLLRETGKVLLDREMDHPVVEEIREAIEQPGSADGTRVIDLHVWRVGKDAYACAVSLVTLSRTLTPEQVREQLRQHEEIVHTTIEIHRCESSDEIAMGSGYCPTGGERQP